MVSRSAIALLCVCVALGSAACSRDVEKAKREYVQRGDDYIKNKNVDAAIIEYRNAIQRDPRFAEAYQKLATAYLTRGDGSEALRASVTAADLLPNADEAQLQAGELLLLSGQFVDARVRAQKVLGRSANNVRARVLLGNATAGLKDIDSAIQQFEEAIRLDPNQSGIYMGLAALKASQGDREAAERTFKQAVETDPKSVTARLALAQFYWSTERFEEAEKTLKAAHDAIPDNARTNMALAVFYQATRRAAEAEPFLRAAVQADPSPRTRTVLADYYIARNRIADAKPLLEPLAKDRRFGALASLRLAGIAQIEGRPEDALQIIDATLTTQPKNATVLAAKADLLRQQRKFDDATKVADQALAVNPASTEAHFVRGRALMAQGRLDQAEQAFNNALKANPRAEAARVELARLKLRNDATEAGRLAAQVVEANPGNLTARLTMARAHVQKQEYTQAKQILDELTRVAPKAAPVHTLMGTLLVRQRDLVGARAAFTRALEIDPMDLESLEGITTLDFSTKQQAAAIARLEALLPRAGSNPGVLTIAAKAYAAARDFGAAERLLVKAIELDPSSLGAYKTLGGVYIAQKRIGEARAQLVKAASREEKPVGVLTVIGMLDLMENRIPSAQEQFEKVLKMDPQAGVAANNLAWIYAEHGGSLDIALQMAKSAETQLPNEAEVSDTLGWIYFKKGLYPQSIVALQRSVQLDPKNANSIYHLALAHEKSGDRAEARRVMSQYLSLDSTSPRGVEIKRKFDALGI